ncbi:hypothetical protein [Singulisphaera sp. PoT]|uniref:hypothetical protein n=1 Tax=Singulisphaera sp. PoT TaxID=3411797 RepID=UPI003BF4C6B3
MPIGDQEFDSFHTHPYRVPKVRFDAISEAWELYKQAWITWTLIALVVIVAYALINTALAGIFGIPKPVNPGGFKFVIRPGARPFHAIIVMIVTGFLVGPMIRIACKQVRGIPIQFDELFNISDVFANLIVGSILAGLAVLVGLGCCVVPGLVIAGLLMFTLPLIVDGGLSPTQAIGQSFQALKGQWLQATLLHLVISFLASLGAACCGVGVLVTAPLYSLTVAVLYRDFFLAKGLGAKDKPGWYGTDF